MLKINTNWGGGGGEPSGGVCRHHLSACGVCREPQDPTCLTVLPRRGSPAREAGSFQEGAISGAPPCQWRPWAASGDHTVRDSFRLSIYIYTHTHTPEHIYMYMAYSGRGRAHSRPSKQPQPLRLSREVGGGGQGAGLRGSLAVTAACEPSRPSEAGAQGPRGVGGRGGSP